MPTYKNPVSVLVVIYTPDNQFLLIERAAHPGYWQSVTGSQETGETIQTTAARELAEETGLIAAATCQLTDVSPAQRLGVLIDHQHSTEYDIYPQWRHRYGPGVTRNTEHLFSFQIATPQTVELTPKEHRDQRWLGAEAATKACFSPSNQVAISLLAKMNLSQN